MEKDRPVRLDAISGALTCSDKPERRDEKRQGNRQNLHWRYLLDKFIYRGNRHFLLILTLLAVMTGSADSQATKALRYNENESVFSLLSGTRSTPSSSFQIPPGRSNSNESSKLRSTG